MADEYGTTPNHSLRFPKDGAPIDTAGDIERLAEDTDNAIGLNWDTATQEQKDAVAASTAPVSLYGIGRPDGKGGFDLIEAPIGSRFTFTGNTQEQRDAVWGARIWSKAQSGWICDVGTSPRVQYGDNNSLILQRSGPSIVCRVYGNGWDGTGTGASTDAGWKAAFGMYGVLYCDNRGSLMPYLNYTNDGSVTVLNGPADPTNLRGGVVVHQGYAGGYAWPAGVPNGDWEIANTQYVIEELKAQIEEAAKDNPELA